jgi:aquaporin Z
MNCVARKTLKEKVFRYQYRFIELSYYFMVIPKSDYKLFVSEMVGMTLLLFIGLSIVIFNWDEGSVVAKLIPSETIRTILTGFMFGCVGCSIALSPIGKISGAHINPAVSIAFWLRGKMKTAAMAGYIVSQMMGAYLDVCPYFFGVNKAAAFNTVSRFPGNME